LQKRGNIDESRGSEFSFSPLFPKERGGDEFKDELYLTLCLKLLDLFYRQVLHFINRMNGYIDKLEFEPLKRFSRKKNLLNLFKVCKLSYDLITLSLGVNSCNSWLNVMANYPKKLLFLFLDDIFR